jgi:hypothetical protein
MVPLPGAQRAETLAASPVWWPYDEAVAPESA